MGPPMHPQKRLLLLINILGGAAVLGSYAWGFAAVPNATRLLWGGVPQSLQPFYTASMLTAALGYFAFTLFTFFALEVETTRIFGSIGYAAFNLLYAIVLFPSALWMPLTFTAMASPGPLMTWAVRVLLAVIGLASLSLLFALTNINNRQPAWAWRLAVIGCALFCLQTVVLDAGVWSAFFTR